MVPMSPMSAAARSLRGMLLGLHAAGHVTSQQLESMFAEVAKLEVAAVAGEYIGVVASVVEGREVATPRPLSQSVDRSNTSAAARRMRQKAYADIDRHDGPLLQPPRRASKIDAQAKRNSDLITMPLDELLRERHR